MNRPVKGFMDRLRRAEEIAPEPELGVDRLAALRIRAALAEDPGLAEEADSGDGQRPIVLARATRETSMEWSGATSWFGGLPKLGLNRWPVGADGIPLPFAAQISLADLAAVSPRNPLPAQGSLAFFLGEGAVVHVPEGVTLFSEAPDGLPISAYWRVQPFALTPAEPEPVDGEGSDAEPRDALEAALPEELPRRSHRFSAADADWSGPVPIWWYGVDYLIDEFRWALGSATDGQRDGLSALIGALEGFAADREPWDRLSAEEHEVFAEALDNAWQQFGDLISDSAPRTVDDLATVSVLAMMTGDAKAFDALPDPVRDLINREYRLPLSGLPQIFGPPMQVADAEGDHARDVLLLQLPSDDMMDWDFGDNGVYQFWMTPGDLDDRRWKAAVLTF